MKDDEEIKEWAYLLAEIIDESVVNKYRIHPLSEDEIWDKMNDKIKQKHKEWL